MTASEPPSEETELSFIVNIMQVASAKHKGIISPASFHVVALYA